MYSKLPLSMENIPRQKTFGCLSLKFGCIFSGIITILYTVLILATRLATVDRCRPGTYNLDNLENILVYYAGLVEIIFHCVTLMLTTMMMVGTLREKPNQMKPWVLWTSCQIIVRIILIVFWTVIDMMFDHIEDDYLMSYALTFSVLLTRFYMLMLVSSYYKQLVEEVKSMKKLLSCEEWTV